MTGVLMRSPPHEEGGEAGALQLHGKVGQMSPEMRLGERHGTVSLRAVRIKQ